MVSMSIYLQQYINTAISQCTSRKFYLSSTMFSWSVCQTLVLFRCVSEVWEDMKTLPCCGLWSLTIRWKLQMKYMDTWSSGILSRGWLREDAFYVASLLPGEWCQKCKQNLSIYDAHQHTNLSYTVTDYKIKVYFFFFIKATMCRHFLKMCK